VTKTKGFKNLENDISTKFNFTQRNPIEILNQLQEQTNLKDNKEFKILYEFIKFRQENSDPRYNIMK